jgi:hypothetical protein
MAGAVACVIFSRLHFAGQAPMTTLLPSPTRKHYRIGDENDYVVLDGGRVIGRIFRQPQAPGRPTVVLDDNRSGHSSVAE